MNTLSTDYSEKLLAIRQAEWLTQQSFASLVGVSLSTVKNYETGQRPARAEVMEKVLKVDRLKKYTMWLLHDCVIPEAGQIAPDLSKSKTMRFRVNLDGIEKKTEGITAQISSQQPDMQAIISSLSNLDDDELKQLAKQLSRQGIMSLLDFLDPENQTLINLAGNRKQAALRLKSMSDEEFREILSKIEECDTLPKEDINDFIEKAS